MLIFILFFTFATTSMMFILGQSIFTDLSDFNRLSSAKRAFLVSESLTEDVAYRLVFETMPLSSTENLTFAGVTAQAVSAYDSSTDIYTVETTAQVGGVVRKSRVKLATGAGTSFNYGLQAGNGGIELSNNSDIYGNVYSNGPVQGSGSAEVSGDIVSAGPTGLIKTIHATGSVYANTIDNVQVDKDAYYNVQVGTNGQNPVLGTRYTPSPNLPPAALPIDATTVQDWKDSIINNGTVIAVGDPACSGGVYKIDTSISIGNVAIECDVIIEKNTTIVTLTGPIWIKGNLNFKSGPELHVDSSLGRKSVQIIVDKPSDRIGSGKITIENDTDFYGSGDSRSFIMLMSMNNSVSDPAINVANSANGDVLVYAGEGLVSIANNIDLREVTGYKIKVANGSSVTYEEGLASLLFTSGPGGMYVLDDWEQIE